MIYIQESQSYGYAERTKHNADQGVTLAYAVDHTTAGERLTQKCAKGKIVKLDPSGWAAKPISYIDKLVDLMRINETRVLNVAGNGIYADVGVHRNHNVKLVEINKSLFKENVYEQAGETRRTRSQRI